MPVCCGIPAPPKQNKNKTKLETAEIVITTVSIHFQTKENTGKPDVHSQRRIGIVNYLKCD